MYGRSGCCRGSGPGQRDRGDALGQGPLGRGERQSTGRRRRRCGALGDRVREGVRIDHRDQMAAIVGSQRTAQRDACAIAQAVSRRTHPQRGDVVGRSKASNAATGHEGRGDPEGVVVETRDLVQAVVGRDRRA